MTNADILKFIFCESQVDAELESILAEVQEAEQLKVKKAPLIKALKSIGIPCDNATVDENGARLVFTSGPDYHAASKILGTVDALDAIAQQGWVAADAGDISDTTELPEYIITFFPIHQAEMSELDKPLTLDKLATAVEAGSDSILKEDADSTSDCSVEDMPALMAAAAAVKDEATVRAFFKQLVASGINFHPDTEFSEYECECDGKRSFNDEQCAILDAAMAKAFEAVEDPYEIGLEIFKSDAFPEDLQPGGDK